MAQAIQTTRPVANPARSGFQLNLHEGWIAGILLALMLISVTVSVAAANWVEGLTQAMWAALGGLLWRARFAFAVEWVSGAVTGDGCGRGICLVARQSLCRRAV